MTILKAIHKDNKAKKNYIFMNFLRGHKSVVIMPVSLSISWQTKSVMLLHLDNADNYPCSVVRTNP